MTAALQAAMPAGGEAAVAVVLDAEATSFLMMGSLSPGMKKHSVTLFEGGAGKPEVTISSFLPRTGYPRTRSLQACKRACSLLFCSSATLPGHLCPVRSAATGLG